MAKWTFDVDNEYAIVYKDGVVYWRVGPWDTIGNPDGAGGWAESFCKYYNENPDLDPLSNPTPTEETPE